ncbi:heterogeneous nuclear ribonucleoprotein U-like protein 1 [Oppia nitens]|uniref:heterogeneous nuclear ribonucleoprotein U-like protein 1 n=1 Tax=Oppia nitens TaxID=1686743 RepID=UPI0023DB6D95|nr:heterogeneous nuclear ribonucleoprotein U-like protein 1 [Oppia nitens]
MREFLLIILWICIVSADEYGGGGYGGYPEKQRHIKLNFGIHVPPIVLKMPRMNMPQVTIKANFLKKPYAKPLEVNLPPPPQISFGEPESYSSYGGGGGGGSSGGYGGSGGSYGNDQYGSKPEVNFHKTIKVEQGESGGYGGHGESYGGSSNYGSYGPPPPPELPGYQGYTGGPQPVDAYGNPVKGKYSAPPQYSPPNSPPNYNPPNTPANYPNPPSSPYGPPPPGYGAPPPGYGAPPPGYGAPPPPHTYEKTARKGHLKPTAPTMGTPMGPPTPIRDYANEAQNTFRGPIPADYNAPHMPPMPYADPVPSTHNSYPTPSVQSNEGLSPQSYQTPQHLEQGYENMSQNY